MGRIGRFSSAESIDVDKLPLPIISLHKRLTSQALRGEWNDGMTASKDGCSMERVNKISRTALVCLTLILVLFFSIHKIESRDFGWLLKTGQYIYENHHVPRADFYSFTAHGNKYIDSHWLFQLLLYVSYRLLGIAGPTLLMAGILLLAFGTVYFIGHDKEKYVITPAFMVAGIVVASERFIVRPHLVTLLLFSIYFLVLERYRKRGGRAIFLLPLFHLVWVNMHGLFVLGLILTALYLGVAILEWKVRLPGRREEEHKFRGKMYYGWLAAVLILMVCESFLSPYGVDVALYPVTLAQELLSEANVVATSVGELSSPLAGLDISRAERYFKWMICLVPLTFLLNLRRLNLLHICLFAVFLYLALGARRNMDLFAVVAVPIAVINVCGFMDELFGLFKRFNVSRLFAAAQPVASLIIMTGMVYMMLRLATDRYYISDRDLTRFGFGPAEDAYPVRAANFLEAAGVQGRMFNDPSDGGYLIWRFYPERKVYFDGRWEVYGNRFFENFKHVCSSPDLFEKQAAPMEIRYALLPHSVGYLQRLIRHMADSPQWKPVYFDAVSLVFVKNVPENAEVIEGFAIDFATFENEKDRFHALLPADIGDPHFSGSRSMPVRIADRIPGLRYPFEEIARANFYLTFGYHDTARLLYEQALKIYPDCEIAHARLGTVYLRQRLYPLALAQFETVDRLNPRSIANLMNLGHLNLVIGRVDEAEEYFERAKKLDPRNAAVRFQLGKIYLRKGLKETGVRELRRALKLNPDLQEARELIGHIEQR